MGVRVKICGITNPADAALAASLGADMIGLNFYAQSVRFIGVEAAKSICEVLRPEIIRVGVFVNSPLNELLQTVDTVGLTMIQLHGDEPPGFLLALGNIPVIRAFRCSEQNVTDCFRYLQECDRLGRLPDAVLIDAFNPQQYGGTGQQVNPEIFARFGQQWPGLPRILAGGLTPNNVEEAIRLVRPDGVDTASGVESTPGTKDQLRIGHFVQAARAAFAQDR